MTTNEGATVKAPISPARKTIGRIGKFIVNVILWGFCVTYIYPFVWLIINSFKDRPQFAYNTFLPPNPFTTYAYQKIFSSMEVYQALFNSIFNTVVSLVFIVALSFMLGYFLSRYWFPGRKAVYGFFMIGMVIPASTVIIPTYILFNKIGLLNTHFTLLFPYIAGALPLSIFLYDSYIKTVPRTIEEAAFVDGANVVQIMLRVVFPICLPISGTVLILNFMGIWNEFQLALILTNAPPFRTIPVWLTTFQSLYSSDMPVRITAMLIGSLPIIIVYLILREKMMEGLAAGAVKG